MILAFARSQSYEPGSNLLGDQAENVWLFLQSRLDVERVVFVGSPSRGTRTAWKALGTPLAPATPETLASVLAGGRELAWIGADATRALAREPAAVAALDRLLAAGGSVYIEPSKRERGAASAVAAALRATTVVELGQPQVETVAVPDDPAQRAAWLVPRTADPRWPRIARLLRVLRQAARRPTSDGAAGSRIIGVNRVGSTLPERSRDHGTLLRGTSSASVLLPDYLRDLAQASGRDVDDPRWSVALQRGYRSQKVVFHLPERGVVLKVTQDPRFNHRLENEYTALRALERLSFRHAIAPRALFAGHHAGLLVVAETRLGGVPFRERSDATPECRLAHAVLGALTDLASAGEGPGDGPDAGQGLAELLGHHRRIHRPPSGQIAFLERQIEVLAAAESELRPVFMHGDPTTLNILVDGERVGLVDWENAEPSGLPLWDVLHFVAAYTAWSARRSGRRWTPRVAQALLLEPSAFNSLLLAAVARYRAATGLPAQLVAPLTYTYWMVLSLREATRRPAQQVNRGFYARLLAQAVAAGERGGVTRLARE